MSTRTFAIFVLLVSALLLSRAEAKAGSEYTIINTGIKAGGCWYDDNHFIVVQGHQSAPGQEFEVEGLYYLDPAKPKEFVRIDLSPIDPNRQKNIRDVSCQGGTVLFHLPTTNRNGNQLYTLNIGQLPVLLTEKTKGFVVPRTVNIKNQYVLAFTSALKERDLQSSATPEEAKTDCPFEYLRPTYRVVCLRHDRSTKQTWLANNTFLTKYLWDETIRVNKDGQYRWVPNPEPPLKQLDGSDLKQGYFLRDLENRVVQEIPTKQGLFQIIDVSFRLAPSQKYLYSVCYKAGDHGDRSYTQGGRICRYLLDGSNRDWEEVVSVQKRPKDPFSLHHLDMNAQGDVVMIERGHRLVASLWKYSAQSNRADKLLQISFPEAIGSPQVSPNGRWVSVIRQSQLVLIESKGAKP